MPVMRRSGVMASVMVMKTSPHQPVRWVISLIQSPRMLPLITS